MPTLALVAHDWENKDSILQVGLTKRKERSEIHFAVAALEKGISDIPTLKSGRLIVFIDASAFFEISDAVCILMAAGAYSWSIPTTSLLSSSVQQFKGTLAGNYDAKKIQIWLSTSWISAMPAFLES